MPKKIKAPKINKQVKKDSKSTKIQMERLVEKVKEVAKTKNHLIVVAEFKKTDSGLDVEVDGKISCSNEQVEGLILALMEQFNVSPLSIVVKAGRNKIEDNL